jgi:sarcosine oxidase, subunit gamma
MADLSSARAAPSIAASPPLRLLPPAARHILRGAPDVMAAAGDALGLSLSMPACRAAVHGSRAALWLGPDERLLLAEQSSATDTADRLAQVLRGQAHSLVDVSHRQVALGLAGPHAVTVLAAGCPLDLDLRAFPDGMCTRTVFAKAEIVLWRRAEDSFQLEVWRSFAAYVSAVIAEAARDLPVLV